MRKRLAYLVYHRVSVDLTHVRASVLFLDALDGQSPCFVLVLDGDPGVVSHEVVVNRLYRLRVGLYPRNL
jgi:hypothetical protein